MQKNRIRRAVVLLLALTLTVSLALGISALADTDPKYDYVLECTEDKDGTDGTIELKLYLKPSAATDPILVGGSFALKFPSAMSAKPYTFAKGIDIQLRQMVPQKRYDYAPGEAEIKESGYHAINWTIESYIERWELASEWDATEERLLIGTYTFEITPKKYPSKTAVGQMDWLETDEAEPQEYPFAEPAKPIPPKADWGEDPYNQTIWNPDAPGYYQGYYCVNEDGSLTKIDIGFTFDPPLTWKNAFEVESYDPKKPMTVELYQGTTLIAGDFIVPIWIYGTDTSAPDGLRIAPGNEENEHNPDGVGAYIAEIDLGSSSVPLTAGDYTLVIKKPGHLTKTINVNVVSNSLSDAEFSESLEAPIYLPCGDINPDKVVEPTTYGDGKIKLNDRSILQAYINRQLTVPPKSVILTTSDVSDPNYAAYLSDLNGDGKITIADLNIIMSPRNYNQNI